jgi:hypothetical protein
MASVETANVGMFHHEREGMYCAGTITYSQGYMMRVGDRIYIMANTARNKCCCDVGELED